MVFDLYDPVLEAFVTFTKDHNTCLFNADYIQTRTYKQKDGTNLSCLLLRVPEYIEETDRRNRERCYADADLRIPVTFWAEPEDKTDEGDEPVKEDEPTREDEPTKENGPAKENEEQENEKNENANEIRSTGFLHDLSLNGIGISIHASDDISLPNNQKCNISILSPSKKELVFVPARYRYKKKMKREKKVILGFQFTVTNTSIEGAKTLAALAQIMNHIQSSCPLELALT